MRLSRLFVARILFSLVLSWRRSMRVNYTKRSRLACVLINSSNAALKDASVCVIKKLRRPCFKDARFVYFSYIFTKTINHKQLDDM